MLFSLLGLLAGTPLHRTAVRPAAARAVHMSLSAVHQTVTVDEQALLLKVVFDATREAPLHVGGFCK